MKAIITLHREDNSIIGDPIVREVNEIDTFEKIAAELDKLVADPNDEITTYQLLGA